ncbi:MAG: beta-glucosidase family protein [Cellulosilyticaceae bacterium]
MKYKDIISKMTLEEKASLMSGKNFWETQDIPRLGIPTMFLSDGPHGIRKQAEAADHLGLNGSIPATCFPTAATIANSWDEALAEELGVALGKEAVSMDVNMLLGPGCNIKRNPRCGRNFEYFSEDPYLSGKFAVSYIKGIQSEGISACVKHFAANNQEERRMVIDTIIDERTLREIYLPAFEMAVKEGKTKSIMSSYNMLNGKHTNEHKHLLVDILRNEWQFDGVVVTDWGGENDRIEGLLCGNELEMPSDLGDSDAEIISAVQNGSLKEEVLDACLERLLELTFTTDDVLKQAPKTFDQEKHHALAQKAAEASIVLLKNEAEILPLAKEQKIAIIGDFAKTPRYQGAGSSIVNPTKLDSALGVVEATGIQFEGYEQGYHRFGKKDLKLQEAAVALAKKADVVLYYMGLDEVKEEEGLDRTDINMPSNQIAVLEALAQVNENIVVVLSCGAVVEMSWIKHAKAVVHTYLSGQAGAKAVFTILKGEVNPSGKLAETYPYAYEDVSSVNHFPGKEVSVEYREGIYVGYRYYSTAGIDVRFPFGYGLSYTTFEYSNLTVEDKQVSFDLTNTGKYAGAEVAQLYVKKGKTEIFRAERELKGFQKVFLQPGETKQVTIQLDDRAFSYYNTKTTNWEIEKGAYQILVGASCTDIRLNELIILEGTDAPNPYQGMALDTYLSGHVKEVGLEEFEALLGFKAPNPKWDRSKELGYNDTLSQMQYAKGFVARLAYHLINASHKMFKVLGKRKIVNIYEMVIFHLPFRGLARMSGGAFSMEMVDGLLIAVNGNFIKGMKHLRQAAKKREECPKYRYNKQTQQKGDK